MIHRFLAVALTAGGLLCGAPFFADATAAGDAHDDHDHAVEKRDAAGIPKGPHGGKWFEHAGFANRSCWTDPGHGFAVLLARP